jgi:peptidylprolyl isomerase
MIGAVAVAGLVGCGGGDAEPADAAAGAETATAEATPGALATVVTEYSAELNVNLAEMTKSETGLYTKDILEGTGDVAKTGDRVRAHYTGWLPDGTMFDSSMDGDAPIEFGLGAGELIKGWDEGMVGMKVGGRRRLVIPPGLAYGAAARDPIPAMSTLVFDIELVEIVK